MGRRGPPLSLRLWEGRGAAGRGQVSAVTGCDVAGGVSCGAETQRRGRRGASCRPRAVAGGRGHRASITDSSGRGHGQTPALCTVHLSRSGRVARGRRRALLPPRPARTAADTPGHAAGFPPQDVASLGTSQAKRRGHCRDSRRPSPARPHAAGVPPTFPQPRTGRDRVAAGAEARSAGSQSARARARHSGDRGEGSASASRASPAAVGRRPAAPARGGHTPAATGLRKVGVRLVAHVGRARPDCPPSCTALRSRGGRRSLCV